MGNHVTFEAYTARRAANNVVTALNSNETLTASLRQGAVQEIGEVKNLPAGDLAIYTEKVANLRVPEQEMPPKVVQRTFVNRGDSPLYDRFMFQALDARTAASRQARNKQPVAGRITAEALQRPRMIPIR